MAYLRELEVRCYTPLCEAKAAVVLIDRRNNERGVYCRKCGEKRLKALKEAEAKDA